MWRQNASLKNQVPGRNLSDVDEELDKLIYDNDCSENLQSLYSRNREKKNEILLSENEFGIHKFNNEGRDPLHISPRKGHCDVSGDESISDEETSSLSNVFRTCGGPNSGGSDHHTVASNIQDAVCTWSAVSEAAKELASLHKKAVSSSSASGIPEARTRHKGGCSRSKLKFAIHSHSHQEVNHVAKDDSERVPWERIEDHSSEKNLKYKAYGNSMAELLGNLQEENDGLAIKLVSHTSSVVPSVAELLEDIQEKNKHSLEASDMFFQNVGPKERKSQVAGKRTDDEDPPEFIDGITSTDDEDNYQNNVRCTTNYVKGQTMADLFQEAFSTSILDEPIVHTCKQTGGGYHHRLQQIMQTEKDKHLEFSRQMQARPVPCCESGFIDVQILSRVLEAKLTVCQCSFGESNESSQGNNKGHQKADYEGMLKRTVIFSSKLCDNVELEVGNRVRIHSPWREIQVNECEKIVLCTYFSQVIS